MFEINLKLSALLFVQPKRNIVSKHLHELQRVIEPLSKKRIIYENMIFVGNYNVEPN